MSSSDKANKIEAAKRNQITHSYTEWDAIFFETTENANGTHFARLALCSGNTKDTNQFFLNGSFVVGKTLAARLARISTKEGGLRCKVKIKDLQCDFNIQKDASYLNYSGYLNALTLSS